MKFWILLIVAYIITTPVMAQNCQISDRACMVQNLLKTSETIENENWRDQIIREIAKTLATDSHLDEAIALLPTIQNPDTRALTIRGIGMAAAKNKLSKQKYDTLFITLRKEAEKIKHPPSYAIALTYIAMSQAFAGDDEGAWKTAGEMENNALRHKAYGETAEIQAELGKFDAAMKSIGFIKTESFRNKAYSVVSKILANAGKLQNAYDAAEKITNSYKKSKAIQYILNIQKEEEENNAKNGK